MSDLNQLSLMLLLAEFTDKVGSVAFYFMLLSALALCFTLSFAMSAIVRKPLEITYWTRPDEDTVKKLKDTVDQLKDVVTTQQAWLRRINRWAVIALFSTVFVYVLSPSRATMYMVAGSQAGERVVRSPEVKEIYGEIRAWIQQQIKQEKK